jgi:hypothetical protein
MRGLAWLLASAALLTTRPAAALPPMYLEVASGTAVHAPSRLTINQSGFPTEQFNAQYATHPFSGHAPYYRVRIGMGPVFLEALHNKLYLNNPNSVVQSFEVSHGYSIIGPGVRWGRGPLNAFIAGGPVLTNAESTVRGMTHDAGYAIGGIGAHGGLALWLPDTGFVHVTFEVGASAAWAQVDIANGNATVPDFSLHLTIGLALGQ